MSQSLTLPLSEETPAGDELIQLVVNRLKTRFGGRMHDIHVSTHDDGLILGGHSASFYGKQMAQEVAMEVTGLKVHSNDIEVQASASNEGQRFLT